MGLPAQCSLFGRCFTAACGKVSIRVKTSMVLTEKDFQVLDALDRHEITTQRQLAQHAGISLGQVNHVLKSLLDKGFVKLGNFRRNPSKIGYAYLLTPKGIEVKSRLGVRFVIRRLHEYNNIRQVLVDRIAEIEEMGASRVLIVGPEIIREFLDSIIRENRAAIVVVNQCSNWKELTGIDPDTYDIVILSDGSDVGIKAMSNTTGIPRQRLMTLW